MLYLKIKEGTGIMVFPYINIIFFVHYIEMLIDGKSSTLPKEAFSRQPSSLLVS
jgi:hypothetical protein